MQFVIPERVVSHFHLREGDLVGDFGAGSGFFIPTLSRAVGESGKIYAFEIQKQLIEKISSEAEKGRLTNVHVVWCDIEEAGGCKADDAGLDAGVLANTLFQMEDKKQALTEIGRLLRAGGKLFVIDWSESFDGLGSVPEAVVSKEDARELIESCGFKHVRDFEAGEHHYGLAFQKE